MSSRTDNRYSSFMTMQDSGMSLNDAAVHLQRLVATAENTYRASCIRNTEALQKANTILTDLVSVYKRNMGAIAAESAAPTARSVEVEAKSESTNTFKPF